MNMNTNRAASIAMDKQKTLLSADVGHFSLVRAMHLADAITLLNGTLPLHQSDGQMDLVHKTRSSE